MKTDDLVTLLASHAGVVDRTLPARRYGAAMAIGAIGALLLMLAKFGIRPDMVTVIAAPLFWIKLAFPLVMAVGAFMVVTRLARPGVLVGQRWALLAVPVIAVWLGALLTLGLAPPSERLAMVMGISWRSCPFNILYLSVPGVVAIFWAVKGMAPTRLRVAGSAAGLLAGSMAAFAYCLHCPEMDVAFWAVWYLTGMLLPAVVGALLGPRLLRW